MPTDRSLRRRVLARARRLEARRIASLLRTESVGGGLLVVAAIAAIVIANSPLADAFFSARNWHFGPAALHLHLSVGEWAADGLLAIFFFLAGLELKHELLTGELRDMRRAVVPVAAAVGGMAVPALVYVAINAAHPDNMAGWAVPTATDIAFALAVLAVIGRHLPATLRSFLLTLAVVDDLLAIIIIAVFYTSDMRLGMLAVAVLAIAVFGVVIQRYWRHVWVRWLVLLPLALAAWAAMHASGVHATVAGVLLGFTVPVLATGAAPADRTEGDSGYDEDPGIATSGDPEGGLDIAARLDRWIRPISAGFAVPLFAFFAAGVSFGGLAHLAGAFRDTVTLGIVAGLVAGKTVGIFGATLITAIVVRARFLRAVSGVDLLGLSMLGGIGFTVSLLIGDLAFAATPEHHEDAQIAVLAGSVVAAVLGAVVLGIRNRHYRAVAARAQGDARNDTHERARHAAGDDARHGAADDARHGAADDARHGATTVARDGSGAASGTAE